MSQQFSDRDIDQIVSRVLDNIERALGTSQGQVGGHEQVQRKGPLTEDRSRPVALPAHVAKLLSTSQGTLVSRTQLGSNAQADSSAQAGGTESVSKGPMTPLTSQVPLVAAEGVFERMEEAIAATYQAQRQYAKKATVKDRDRIVEAIRSTALANQALFARLMYEETGIGRESDKVLKVQLAASKTPGTEDLTTLAKSGDEGLMLEEMAPFGVIGAITPVTNPIETLINNGISMLAAGNGVVFNVHPSTKQCTAAALRLIHQAIVAAGAPENLMTMVAEPSLETLRVLSESPKVALLVGTGGSAMVKSLLSSGKKAIGAGAGNPPVIVDATADLALAAKAIVFGASFDNNLLCIAEKSVFALASI